MVLRRGVCKPRVSCFFLFIFFSSVFFFPSLFPSFFSIILVTTVKDSIKKIADIWQVKKKIVWFLSVLLLTERDDIRQSSSRNYFEIHLNAAIGSDERDGMLSSSTNETKISQGWMMPPAIWRWLKVDTGRSTGPHFAC